MNEEFFSFFAHSQQKSKLESKVKFDKFAKYRGRNPLIEDCINVTETKKRKHLFLRSGHLQTL